MPRRTQAKAPKDLNAPRRPLSSYMLFSKHRMPSLRGDPSNQGKKITELTKIVGAEWKAMTAEEKLPFESEAKENKENFNREMNEYKQTEIYAAFQTKLQNWKISQKEKAAAQMDVEGEDERPLVRAKALKRPKDPNAPKKPMTGFFIFQTGRRPELKEVNPGKKHTELVKMASEEWKGMSAEQKEPYEAQAREKKAAYNEQMKAYKETEEYQKHQAALAAWRAGKIAPQKQVRKQQAPPVRTPAESAGDSDDSSDSEDSSSSDGKPAQRRSFSSGSESGDESESDVDMRDRNASVANGDDEDDESESDSESDW